MSCCLAHTSHMWYCLKSDPEIAILYKLALQVRFRFEQKRKVSFHTPPPPHSLFPQKDSGFNANPVTFTPPACCTPEVMLLFPGWQGRRIHLLRMDNEEALSTWNRWFDPAVRGKCGWQYIGGEMKEGITIDNSIHNKSLLTVKGEGGRTTVLQCSCKSQAMFFSLYLPSAFKGDSLQFLWSSITFFSYMRNGKTLLR